MKSQLAGEKQRTTSVVRGVDNVRQLIRREFLEKSSAGDTLRLTQRLDNLVGVNEKMSLIDLETRFCHIEGR